MPPKRQPHDAELLDALSHPLRLQIMRASIEQFSPKQLSDTFEGVSVQLLSYHVRILRDAGLLKPSGTRQRRGAIEHFYRASPQAGERIGALGTALTALSEEIGAGDEPPKKRTRAKR